MCVLNSEGRIYSGMLQESRESSRFAAIFLKKPLMHCNAGEPSAYGLLTLCQVSLRST